jgi:hypothetical protein
MSTHRRLTFVTALIIIINYHHHHHHLSRTPNAGEGGIITFTSSSSEY